MGKDSTQKDSAKRLTAKGEAHFSRGEKCFVVTNHLTHHCTLLFRVNIALEQVHQTSLTSNMSHVTSPREARVIRPRRKTFRTEHTDNLPSLSNLRQFYLELGKYARRNML